MTAQSTFARRRGVRGLALALLIGAPMMMTTFGAGAASATTSSKPTKAAIGKTCQRVADVLSDGPDPGVDPVGYALAQVLPLREIKTSDKPLHTAIDNLANAFEILYKTNDKKGTQTTVNKAGKKLDAICPGAF